MRNHLTIITIFSSLTIAACAKGDDKPSSQEASSKAPAVPAPAAKPSQVSVRSSPLAKAAGDYTIDAGHTQLVFRVNHLGTSDQYGLFTKTEGSFHIGSTLAESSIALKVNANSVFTALKKRDDHLKGPDFFDAKQFPNIRFASTSVRDLGNGRIEVDGSLTMHGTTKPLQITLAHGGSWVAPFERALTGTSPSSEVTLG